MPATAVLEPVEDTPDKNEAQLLITSCFLLLEAGKY